MRKTEPVHLPSYRAVPFSSYREVTDFLREREVASILSGRPSVGPVSLGAMARCLHELGRPDHGYRSIHVTGTNGKTSVSAMIAALLQAGGRSVGVFNSGRPGQFRERITVNGEPISEQAFVDACSHLKQFTDWESVELTSFEFLTATAFFAFRAAKVDYAVIEVGVGGRQDPTNIIAPDVSVITNVDYDHMDLLGDTLEAIAAEKAGIIKPFTPLVCGPMIASPRDVVLKRAAQVHAPLLSIDQDYEVLRFSASDTTGSARIRIGEQVFDDIAFNTPARFMATNAAQALTVYDLLRRRGLLPALAEDDVRRRFAQPAITGSSELLHGTPRVLFDGAHNGPAAAALATLLRQHYDEFGAVLLLAIAEGKDYVTMLSHLADARVNRVIMTGSPESGMVSPLVLAQQWRRWSSAAAEVVAPPDEAWARAVRAAGPQGLVVVSGSPDLTAYYRSVYVQAPPPLSR